MWCANGRQPNSVQKPVAGSETLSKRGNKVWVSASFPRAARARVSRRRNRVWVSSLAGSPALNLKKTSTDRQWRMKHVSVPCTPSNPTIKRALASRVVRKSLVHVWHARKQTHLGPNSSSSSQQCCTFYNRFGKCSRGDKCPFIHDPERVAVCTKFLRGVCTKTDGTCPFYHKAVKEKMPVCSFFLRGVCARDGCPYLHASVGKNADVCPDFVRGYCSRGDQCDKKHITDCPEYSRSGKCPQGKKCPLRHRQRSNNRHITLSEKGVLSPMKEPYAFKKIRQKLALRHGAQMTTKQGGASGESVFITPEELEFIPLEAPLGKDSEKGES